MRSLLVALASACVVSPAHAQIDQTREAKLVESFAALCPLLTDSATQSADRQKAEAVGELEQLFTTGPGVLISSYRRGDEQMTVVHLDHNDIGFCLVRFAPVSRQAMEAELVRRLNLLGKVTLSESADHGAAWWVDRTDGRANAVFRRAIAGETGPVWVGNGGYRFGYNAAEPLDALIFYAPSQVPKSAPVQ